MEHPVTADDRRVSAIPLADLLARRHPRNPKDHDIPSIQASFRRFGFTVPVLLDERADLVAAGHGRIEALDLMRIAGEPPPAGVIGGDDTMWLVPTVIGWRSTDDDELLAYVVADNHLTTRGGWTDDLGPILSELVDTPQGLPPGFTSADLDDILAGLGPAPDPDPVDAPAPNPPLVDRFVFPPFSILDARSGPWQERKRRWMSLGIRSEVGRSSGARAIKGIGAQVPDYFDQKRAAEAAAGRTLSTAEFEAGWLRIPEGSTIGAGGVSVFDPVICELAYRWFTPAGGRVLDPFAGGSVRGIVAAALGREYVGVELSAEQVRANYEQAETILPLIADPPDTVTVRVSAASMRQEFHGCEPDYIRDVCHAACCSAPGSDEGTMVTIHPSEAVAIEARGGRVKNGMLQPVDRHCPFEDQGTHLCGLHGTDDKPFGCIASPLTLNTNGTLIVRNRYRLLPCYTDTRPDGTQLPVYRAWASSLRLLFGDDGAAKLTAHLDAGGGDIDMPMAVGTYRILQDNDALKHGAPVAPDPESFPAPVWHQGDSHAWLRDRPAVGADLLFSCPPYADLEVYSDDPADISGMPWDTFLHAYRAIIGQGVRHLADDRFAVWVVGEVRDRKTGLYRGLVPETIRAFQDAGAALYNEGILVSPPGALPAVVARQFTASRKLGKTHQNVLVFVKGDPRRATAACGNVQVTAVPDADMEVSEELP